MTILVISFAMSAVLNVILYRAGEEESRRGALLKAELEECRRFKEICRYKVVTDGCEANIIGLDKFSEHRIIVARFKREDVRVAKGLARELTNRKKY